MKIAHNDKANYLIHLQEIYIQSYNQFFREVKKGNRVEDLFLLRICIDNILTEIELIEADLAKRES